MSWQSRVPGLECRQVHESTVSATPKSHLISWKLFSTVENNANEFAFGSHPLLLVKSNITWDSGVYGMVTTHCDLRRVSVSCKEAERMAYVLSRMELCTTLANDYVARDNILI